MTRQEIFNTVYFGMIAQGQPSITKEGVCIYRGPNNTKCAIGMLLTDEEVESFRARAGNYGVIHLFYGHELPKRFKKEDLDFYVSLQRAHDAAALATYSIDESVVNIDIYKSIELDFITSFHKRMVSVAKRYNLVVPVKETIK